MKIKEIKNMGQPEKEKKLKELKVELLKSKAGASKTGSSKIKEIKKTIARIKTIQVSEKKMEEKK
ncbi:MAG: 50S ribosomal protein L29 [Nanoarchaeota archaeon]|nr:50S ribosomal protein L29 [Nanoarchaeota archaeon]